MAIYSMVIETLILIAVVFEAMISWKNLQARERTRLRRSFNKVMRQVGLGSLVSMMILTSGCVTPQKHREIKLIKSNTEIYVKTLDIEKGDVIICDNEKCKVVQP
jgi:hypothetical protein